VSGLGTNTFYYTAGLFYQPVSAEFEVGQSAGAGCAVIGTVASLLLASPLGRLVDRYGVRRITIGGVLAYSLSLVGLGLYRGPFIGFAALSVIMAVVGMAAGPIVVTRVISGQFTRARGLTLGIVTAGPGLAALTGTYTYGICTAAAHVQLGALGVVFLPRQRHWQPEPAQYPASGLAYISETP